MSLGNAMQTSATKGPLLLRRCGDFRLAEPHIPGGGQRRFNVDLIRI